MFLLRLLLLAAASTTQVASFVHPNRHKRWSRSLYSLRAKPKVIVFDLDGCLWRPEMYELAWDGNHAPFEQWGSDKTRMKSRLNTVVRLIGDVPQLLDEVAQSEEWQDTIFAISSCTDEPTWARELLGKFECPESGKTLQQVITGPWEISYDAKTNHFQRIAQKTGISLQDMMFFDNEERNCRSVSKLGVTVAYAPSGVKRSIWQQAMTAFPVTDGSVIGM